MSGLTTARVHFVIRCVVFSSAAEGIVVVPLAGRPADRLPSLHVSQQLAATKFMSVCPRKLWRQREDEPGSDCVRGGPESGYVEAS